MSFDDLESSRDRGAPITLIRFIYGTGPTDYLAYTNAEQPVTVDGVSYVPIPVDRDAIKSSGNLDKSKMTVRTPHDSDIAKLFLVYPPAQEVSVIIREGHFGDPDKDFKVVWSGRVLSCSREDSEASLTCEPIQTSIRRSGLRRNWQIGCPHALYGPRCRAQMAPRTYPRQIVALAGQTVTLDDGWLPADLTTATFVGGMIRWQGKHGTEYRTILKIQGANSSVLVLAGILRDLEVGGMIDVIAGCAHNLDDCEHVHANVPNYGGQPWIPLENPVGTNVYV